ncbi:glycoside hydrolase family 3 C-terminal domain-containing protein [Paramicrobacterium chengjingii]|uniref:glycoside hydrolase family 3 C-terminal domain-containing protein n=1 Tax=Paramicrobacterium chengjingii TaxID=2769067 RepID=UPI001F453EA1|nr:glycoside hydrolase family 3 C-terminal domain-containing protein [Microbacterium chengjingii]
MIDSEKQDMTQHPSVPDLTRAEKASLTSGADMWRTQPLPRVGVDAIMMTDGPHGLRKQETGGDHLGLGGSYPATCFPPAVALGASFDPKLIQRVGAAIGAEAVEEEVAVVLGPGINIKRSPLCGRNFEYLSEDPLVSGVLGAAMVDGIQSTGVGSSLKHFAANNQETDRMRVSADIAPRPLREIYLRGFERVVKAANPWTVMCSYNRLNGVYASENRWLLTDVLRSEWGFGGLVVSDWGAVNDRVAALAAGLDLEMPGNGGHTDEQIARALDAGTLDESALDTAAVRVLDLVRKAARRPAPTAALDLDAHHRLAREVAARCVVLLKNEGNVLPLARDSRIAVIGAFAEHPRYQGAGSSQIRPTRLDSALGEMRALAGGEVSYAPGFAHGNAAPEASANTGTTVSSDPAALRAEASRLAADSDVAVVFLGLPERVESEGFDREHIDLPAEQLQLLDAVRRANPRTVVVLSHGGVVALPFADDVPAIVDGSLLGQAGGGALADVLFGDVNPSGKLTETVPRRIEDTAAFGNFPGEDGHVAYGEGLLVGYRWFDARRIEPTFPFGHGLSYTSFGYGEARASIQNGDIVVRVPVTNTGAHDGREIVQVYTSLADSRVQRAPRELTGFQSAEISAGETVEVEIVVRREDLAVWDTRSGRWQVEGGQYDFHVASSSRDIRSTLSLSIDADPGAAPLSRESSIGEVLADPFAAQLVRETLAAVAEQMPDVANVLDDDEMMSLMSSYPIGRLPGYGGLPLTVENIDELIALANAGPAALGGDGS